MAFNDDNISVDLQSVEGPNDTVMAEPQERSTLARKESRNVACLNGAVFVVLLMACVVVCRGVYTYMSDDQRNNFENAFKADADKLLEAFQRSVDRQLEALDALAVAFTSHALASDSVFPNVTLPDFGVRASNSRALSGNFMINYHPLVTDETRKGWEAYQMAHIGHYEKDSDLEFALRSRQNSRFNHTEQGVGDFESSLYDQIFQVDAEGIYFDAPQGTGPWLPTWHMSPVYPDNGDLNFDLLSHPAFTDALRETLAHGKAVVDATVNLEAELANDTSSFYSDTLLVSQYRANMAEYLGDPMSALSYPVFDSFDLDERQVAGVLESAVYWHLFFKGVIPEGTQGICCVLENTRGQSFTYSVSGDNVTYLGNGDLHDRSFDALERNFGHMKQQESSLESKSFTSVEWNHEYCRYSLRVYPSRATKEDYVNDDPLRAMMVVVVVFLFTSAVFVFYTAAVDRRQRVVMDRAIASGAIVSSLFPSQVRDQIYQESGNEASSMLFRRDSSGDDSIGWGRHIASVYESTTIMFADMAGFTNWSSSRHPVQVFELLETLYQAFDAIAVRRKVFKVETIGDCYVAVAGLPEPQEDHAVIMAKFADACMTKMKQLTTQLVDTLGDDTATLAMRVGLHSGSVTGGVLRGQRSRFQLFGDAMNTASRMESNGVANRIHVSQQTANELIAAGKSNWVTPRNDKIVAKGKGVLQTYWVTIR